jgi:hypothetical protein
VKIKQLGEISWKNFLGGGKFSIFWKILHLWWDVRHAFIGPIVAAMREHENENDRPSTTVQNTLKTTAIIEAAWHSSTQNMTRIQHIHN